MFRTPRISRVLRGFCTTSLAGLNFKVSDRQAREAFSKWRGWLSSPASRDSQPRRILVPVWFFAASVETTYSASVASSAVIRQAGGDMLTEKIQWQSITGRREQKYEGAKHDRLRVVASTEFPPLRMHMFRRTKFESAAEAVEAETVADAYRPQSSMSPEIAWQRVSDWIVASELDACKAGLHAEYGSKVKDVNVSVRFDWDYTPVHVPGYLFAYTGPTGKLQCFVHGITSEVQGTHLFSLSRLAVANASPALAVLACSAQLSGTAMQVMAPTAAGLSLLGTTLMYAAPLVWDRMRGLVQSAEARKHRQFRESSDGSVRSNSADFVDYFEVPKLMHCNAIGTLQWMPRMGRCWA